MIKIEIETHPKSFEDEKVNRQVELVVKERNLVIAKNLNVEPKDIKVSLYRSQSELKGLITNQLDAYGEFGGYREYSDNILLIHPKSIEGGFFEDVDKEIKILVDYALLKFYINKKYFPEKKDFTLYKRYLSDSLSKIISGKFKELIAKFEFRMYKSNFNMKKEREILTILYIMKKNSGIDFIYENMDLIFEHKDIKKTIHQIYDKNLDEMILPEQKKLFEEEDKLKKTFKPGIR